MPKHRAATTSNFTLAVVIVVVVIIGTAIAYLVASTGEAGKSSSTSSTNSVPTMQGIVVGYVTVLQSTCSSTGSQSASSSCTPDLSGYTLLFTSQCETSSGTSPSTVSCLEQAFSAPIGPNGHYSVLLAPGAYMITGLSPSCNWTGCSSVFPRAVTVIAGQQLVVNIEIGDSAT
jgi:hypothetical protein